VALQASAQHDVRPAQHSLSQRVRETDAPVIAKTKQLIADAGRADVLSLAQGVVHWQPPPAALQRAAHLLASDPGSISSYGPAEGLPALRQALAAKLQEVNGLQGYEVMVTAGANQAFTNIVLALCNAGDKVVLFRPYYFNHLMALQMTGGGRQVVLGECGRGDLRPDLGWLRAQLQGPQPPRLVVLANPCNPTGVLLSKVGLRWPGLAWPA
jgi:aspartate/methionine/tyrosine aminotransferase